MNTPARLGTLLAWLDDRTGLVTASGRCCQSEIRGCPWLRSLWPGLIVFAFVVQVITGIALWMYYSPSAQTAWESVYYVQYEVAGGWLLRGIHHYAAQVLVALLGLYLLQLIVSGLYRKPREFVYWTAVFLGLVALALCLTGDLLPWSQNNYSATQTRVSFLMLLPGIGGPLYKLAAGGSAFGHLTATRFFALHVGVFAVSFLVLLVLHGVFQRRAAASDEACRTVRYWPCTFLVNTVACLVVMAVVLLLVYQHAWQGDHAGLRPGDYLGVPLAAPADPDPANAYAAARPEWSFRGLYELTHLFSGKLQIVPIFVLPTLTMIFVLAMPIIGRWFAGHLSNIVVTLALVLGLTYLSYRSYRTDYSDPEWLGAVAKGEQKARRVIALAQAKGIPATGALSLLRDDPQTQGPIVFAQHCGACHPFSSGGEGAIKPETASAPELYQFASRAWLTAFFDAAQLKSPKYYGNTRFAGGIMVEYVESRFAKLDADAQKAIIAALSAEAQLASQAAADAADQALITKGRELIVSEGCTRCHRFRDQGVPGDAPDLTGYGSREWLVGILADPAHAWFYSGRNDRMPAYAEAPEEPAKNRLSDSQLGSLVTWLRGEGDGPAAAQAPVPVTLGKWLARRTPAETPPTDAKGQALAVLRLAQCTLCHDYSDGAGNGLAARQPSAPTLYRFASAEWIRGLLDPEQVGGPRYFGTNKSFADGEMAKFVKEDLGDAIDDAGETALDDMIEAAVADSKQLEFAQQHLADLKQQLGDEEFKKKVDEAVAGDKFADFVKEHAGSLAEKLGREKYEKLIASLAAEAQQDEPPEADEEIEMLFEDFTCADCHKFHNTGDLGSAPDLTGYGSREWLTAILTNPEDERFYPDSNDGMPAYHAVPEAPQQNLLTKEQIAQLVDLLRGKLEPTK